MSRTHVPDRPPPPPPTRTLSPHPGCGQRLTRSATPSPAAIHPEAPPTSGGIARHSPSPARRRRYCPPVAVAPVPRQASCRSAQYPHRPHDLSPSVMPRLDPAILVPAHASAHFSSLACHAFISAISFTRSSSIDPPPGCAVRPILERYPLRRPFGADRVRTCKVTRLACREALGDRRLDRGHIGIIIATEPRAGILSQ